MTKSITETTTESDSVTLKKGAKGHQWEIKVYGATNAEIEAKINSMNKALAERYGNEE